MLLAAITLFIEKLLFFNESSFLLTENSIYYIIDTYRIYKYGDLQ